MHKALKKGLRLLLGPYRLIRIYALDLADVDFSSAPEIEVRALLGPEEMESARDRRIREHAWFAAGSATAYGAWQDGRLVSACALWDAARFRDDAVGTLSDDEAALVDVVTDEAYSRRGFASEVVRYAAQAKKNAGYRRLVCTVWHNNHASIRVFEKAGWRYVALVFEFFPLGSPAPRRIRWGARSSSGRA